MKQLLAMILAVLMAIIMFGCAATPIGEDRGDYDSGFLKGDSTVSTTLPHDGLEYELSSNGNYYIVTGIGDFKGSELMIPAEYNHLPVKEVADRAFDGCSELVTVIMSDNIITVGDFVFYGCENLTNVVMPRVISMGNSVFFGVKSIKNITIPVDHIKSLTNVKELETIVLTSVEKVRVMGGAFTDCVNLRTVTVLEGVKEIGESAFEGCSSLSKVELPVGLTNIEDKAFSRCKALSEISLPESTTSIGTWAFRECTSLEAITIPGGAELGRSVFWGCSSLRDVTLQNGIETLGAYVFHGCESLSTITIPKSMKYISFFAFKDSGLTRAKFEVQNGWTAYIDNMLVEDILLDGYLSDESYAAYLIKYPSGDHPLNGFDHMSRFGL